MATNFTAVYDCFLGKITDDMYMELTPEDTLKDLQKLLIHAIPGFEFPRIDLYNYNIETAIVNQEDTEENDFVIGIVWQDLFDEELDEEYIENPSQQKVIIEKSVFAADLSPEEINILAILMMQLWLQRQVTSIENTRMKYSGSDFKMTSQANHLSKLQSLLNECQRQSHHMQRLYKRRKIGENGVYESTWSWFKNGTGNLH